MLLDQLKKDIAKIPVSYYNLLEFAHPLGLARFCFKRTSCSPRTNLSGGALFYFLPKERAVRKKQSIFILILLAILTACRKDPQPTATLPVITPSVTGLSSIEIDGFTRDSIRDHLSAFLNTSPYTKYEAGGQLLNYLVSSGEFAKAEVTLESGETIQADVIYAYTLMSTGKVLVAPVLVGLSLPDGTYAYFSENYSLDPQGNSIPAVVDRETALADAEGAAATRADLSPACLRHGHSLQAWIGRNVKLSGYTRLRSARWGGWSISCIPTRPGPSCCAWRMNSPLGGS